MDDKLILEFQNFYAEEFENLLVSEQMTFRKECPGNDVLFYIMMPSEWISALAVGLRFSAHGDVKLFARLASLKDDTDKIPVILTLNKLNREYRFARLVLDEDDDVMAFQDMVLDEDECTGAKMIRQTLMIFASVCDEVLPEVLSHCWSEGYRLDRREMEA